MNMQSKRPITAAEQALVDTFVNRIDSLPGDGAIAAIRNGFMDDIKFDGLPTRRVEAWHYTDLRNLLKSVPEDNANGASDAVAPLVDGSDVLVVSDGRAWDATISGDAELKHYREALNTGTAAHRMVLQSTDDLIGRLNGALAGDGFDLTVPANAELKRPVEIQVLQDGGQAHCRFSATVGEGAKGTFFERHIGGETDTLVSSITDLKVGAEAQVFWVISQERGLSDTHFGQINIELGANAQLTLFVANSGGKLVRQEINIKAKGEGSELALSGVNLLGGDSHTDVTMVLDHLEPDCVSTETFRNVVFDRAHGVFQGQINVAQIAQKTDARMACNTLLLSDDGDFSAKPELEIFADDVQCAHGATVADIDENHLFYLRARGISEKRARSMLVNAFIAEIVEELEDPALIEALETRFENWLDHHG
ncbi:Fe-S cluster assembly protein SufD [Hoeflea prorocentri]|uniref:Fe-S cluster assembly protein SufD n=1 Tax=Hoeflea prorocentri TaxID=1922333 RepID=A0A9X3UHA4_9HYPH|nr:Fe-S cluster assembly protein SufD [Hoeflea prorocentri]MCY6380634.1 Fe-S cluster assembly protein SufD [Hoeflea prorocentri]MDA5398434.1 Fe-S cluster assembly protein SufD [Hoeflea prorocentri]